MASETKRAARGGAGAVGVAVALAVHGGVATALVKVDPSWLQARAERTVELEVVEPPPPPPPPPEPVDVEPPPPEPPPEQPRPRVAMRRAPVKAPPPNPEPPPPPNQEPPPEPPAEPTPPTFGVTLDSTVTGESNVAVPVGNTLMTKDRAPAKPAQAPQAYASDGTPGFSPVADTYLGEYPMPKQRLQPPYPPEARRLGLEAQVVLKVGIDRGGKVRAVRVVKKAGHGFDEAAVKTMWKYQFSPPKTKTGEAVDCQITYKMTFRMDE